MVNEIKYTSIRRVLDNLLDHPLMRDLSLEQVVRHTMRFISLHGYPKLYEDRIDTVEIHEYRGLLPCDLVSIVQVKDMHTGICLRAMTDTFTPGIEVKKGICPPHKEKDLLNNVRPLRDIYIPPLHEAYGELTFKTQGRVIYTSFKEGMVEIAYKGIPIDDDGFPMLIDNEVFLAALEAYIKKQVFTVKFETGKMQAGVLQNAKQDYAFLSGQLKAEMTIPSYSEMEAISRSIQTLIPRIREFDKGFKYLGDREYLRKH